MAQDRDAYLNIGNLDNWLAHRPEPWMDIAEREEFAFINFEHFLRVGKAEEGINIFLNLLPDLFPDKDSQGLGKQKTIISIFAWYSNRVSKDKKNVEFESGMKIQELQSYIYEQQAHIDVQQAYIDAQQAHMDKQQADIERQQDRITKQQNEIVGFPLRHVYGLLLDKVRKLFNINQ